jgi:hypothetical protein
MRGAFGTAVVVGVLVCAGGSTGGVLQPLKVDGTYRCRVTGGAELKDDGSLIAVDRFAPGFGTEFHVDRATGLIAGGVADNVDFSGAEVVFTAPDGPFNVLSRTAGRIRQVSLLSVRPSTPSASKPFVFVTPPWVYSGVCR